MHWRAAVYRRFEGGTERGDLLAGAGGRALRSSLEVEFSFVGLSVEKSMHDNCFVITGYYYFDLICLCKILVWGVGGEGERAKLRKLTKGEQH